MTKTRFPDAPERIKALPVDHRGFPVPWFVAWQDGQPVFPAMDPDKLARAVRHERCWVCGEPLGRNRVYVIGPMCVANKVSSEPPSHQDCARFAAINCPFLANPNMKRVPLAKHGGCTENVAGTMIERNPGVTALVTVTGPIRWFRDGPGVLFKVEPIIAIEWFGKGRAASRAEVVESFDSGLPILREMAQREGNAAMAQLAKAEAAARALFPS